jgi:hypothetical protein
LGLVRREERSIESCGMKKRISFNAIQLNATLCPHGGREWGYLFIVFFYIPVILLLLLLFFIEFFGSLYVLFRNETDILPLLLYTNSLLVSNLY